MPWGTQTLTQSIARLIAPLAVLAAAAVELGPGAAPAAAAECRGAAVPAHSVTPKRAERVTLCLINKKRQARDLHPLRSRRAVRSAARRHTRAMIEERCFDHICPGELGLVGRILSAGYLPCGCIWRVAENIAWGAGDRSSPRSIVSAWMRSPGHRANMLDRSFRHIGVAVMRGLPVRGNDSPGATYTTNFGVKS